MPKKLDRFWADPFVIEKNDTYYIFIEECINKNKLGHISVIELTKQGVYSEPKVVLKKEYHLSYPYIIKDNNELYMIPETRSKKRIDIYKCIDFPCNWKFEQTLIKNIECVDSTVLKKDNRYWLFTFNKNASNKSDFQTLSLFYSSSLLSNDWLPHPKNPIKTDIKTCRPAGQIFMENNKLYRPSQNSIKHYGHGIHIYEIVKLTTLEYEEKLVSEIIPDDKYNIFSIHTINNTSGVLVLDAQIKRNKFKNLIKNYCSNY